MVALWCSTMDSKYIIVDNRYHLLSTLFTKYMAVGLLQDFRNSSIHDEYLAHVDCPLSVVTSLQSWQQALKYRPTNGIAIAMVLSLARTLPNSLHGCYLAE